MEFEEDLGSKQGGDVGSKKLKSRISITGASYDMDLQKDTKKWQKHGKEKKKNPASRKTKRSGTT